MKNRLPKKGGIVFLNDPSRAETAFLCSQAEQGRGRRDYGVLRPFLRALENPVRKWYPPPFSHWIFQQSFLRALENAHFFHFKIQTTEFISTRLGKSPKKRHLARLCFLLLETGGTSPHHAYYTARTSNYTFCSPGIGQCRETIDKPSPGC